MNTFGYKRVDVLLTYTARFCPVPRATKLARPGRTCTSHIIICVAPIRHRGPVVGAGVGHVAMDDVVRFTTVYF